MMLKLYRKLDQAIDRLWISQTRRVLAFSFMLGTLAAAAISWVIGIGSEELRLFYYAGWLVFDWPLSGWLAKGGIGRFAQRHAAKKLGYTEESLDTLWPRNT